MIAPRSEGGCGEGVGDASQRRNSLSHLSHSMVGKVNDIEFLKNAKRVMLTVLTTLW
jgi:hypothetical protein